MFPFGETVTHIAREYSGVDGDGNDVFAETPTVLSHVPVWDPRGVEAAQGQVMATSHKSLWLEGLSVAVSHDDLFMVGAETLGVDGDPLRFNSPFTGLSGQQVNLRKVTG